MKLVLCEGKDEVAVIKGLCEASGLSGLTVEPIQGKDRLREVLAELPKRPEFARMDVESLGILLDAGQDPAALWMKLRQDVQATLGFALTDQAVFAGERPKVAGLLVGGKDGHGMLEDTCLQAVSDHPGFPSLEDYFRCLVERTERKEYHAKARFRAWMASQSEYEFHVGKAAEKDFLPWGNPAFDRLRQFLKNL
ncbi:MAG: hypothetical protein HY674_11395 [Chloroflexi bacterium]|nr:hypothetical protein [Chloroflexota bacterium]